MKLGNNMEIKRINYSNFLLNFALVFMIKKKRHRVFYPISIRSLRKLLLCKYSIGPDPIL